MGRRIKEIQHEDLYDYETMEEIDDEFKQEEEINQINVVNDCLRLLISKSTTVREEALAAVIKALEDGSPFYKDEIVENYDVFVDLFHQSMISIENGSSSIEVSLSAYIIGFLALSTVHLGHEVSYVILHKSLPLIYKRLQLPMVMDSTKTLSLLNCLTIITFLVGGVEEEETSPSDVIWGKVTKILGEAKGGSLLAYGFLLTSTNRPATIDDNKISSLLTMLDDCDDSCVRAISAQLLAMIFETYDLTYERREKVLYRVNYRLAVEESKSQWNVFHKVAEFLQHGCLPISTKNNTRRKKDELYVQTSSWTDLIRLKFLKQLLGNQGFSQQIQNNELLQAVLKFSSIDAVAEARVSERKDQSYIWMGKKSVQRKTLRVLNDKRKILNKARTQSLEKGRNTKAANGWMS